ncbi:GNAT family N-acetyltransferase [candidate division CSSED10-310 bacterium]|uniref:GNAT family N-acetyltransferase n=1 Tax=candidate division CSSED10-310 bacterium TaxID=2855610 RepID=A0ABV6YVT4_UNCC1
MEKYPKTVELSDGSKATLQVFKAEHADQYLKFLNGLTEEYTRYLEVDPGNVEGIKSRLADTSDEHFRIFAFMDEKIVGEASLFKPAYGWSQHVGSMKILVTQERRGKNLGFILTREIFLNAVLMKVEKLELRVPETKNEAIKVAEKLNFRKELTLVDHYKDPEGGFSNCAVMTCDIEALWQDMESLMQDYFYSAEL